jgi:hypothetical protein
MTNNEMCYKQGIFKSLESLSGKGREILTSQDHEERMSVFWQTEKYR